MCSSTSPDLSFRVEACIFTLESWEFEWDTAATRHQALLKINEVGGKEVWEMEFLEIYEYSFWDRAVDTRWATMVIPVQLTRSWYAFKGASDFFFQLEERNYTF